MSTETSVSALTRFLSIGFQSPVAASQGSVRTYFLLLIQRKHATYETPKISVPHHLFDTPQGTINHHPNMETYFPTI
jgi:hypothetical protein